jgi:hypothetical protein
MHKLNPAVLRNLQPHLCRLDVGIDLSGAAAGVALLGL